MRQRKYLVPMYVTMDTYITSIPTVGTYRAGTRKGIKQWRPLLRWDSFRMYVQYLLT